MFYNLFIDDIRKVPLEFDLVARNGIDAVEMIKKYKNFNIISFDHDLGINEDGSEMTGNHVLIELLEMLSNNEGIIVKEMYVHSDNSQSLSMIKSMIRYKESGIIDSDTYIHPYKIDFLKDYTFK